MVKRRVFWRGEWHTPEEVAAFDREISARALIRQPRKKRKKRKARPRRVGQDVMRPDADGYYFMW